MLQNDFVKLAIDPVGGAITEFSTIAGGINPLDFKFLHTEPVGEIEFKGHFLCLGNWGDPSPGEQKSGLNKHGEFIKLRWKFQESGTEIRMNATSELEGIHINRIVSLTEQSSCVKVSEVISNINTRGRIYNMVQHPTIAGKFLSDNTIVNCNSTLGFDYLTDAENILSPCSWPVYQTSEDKQINLENPEIQYSSVFPTIVDPESEYGWIIAYSPDHQLLLGYIWKRADYPWINHWIHFADIQTAEQPDSSSDIDNASAERNHESISTNSKMIYRGLEFGTTGMHMSFKEIIDKKLFEVLGERSFEFLDAGEQKERSYFMFLEKVPEDFPGVEEIILATDHILIKGRDSSEIQIAHSFK
jgi:hypothetical protein